MLIHITPKIYLATARRLATDVIDVTVPELGLILKNGRDITAMRPYPNKGYFVACRRQGLKAINGLLIAAPEHLAVYTVITRWAVDGKHVTTHRVEYRVLDQDHDTVTDQMWLWRAGPVGEKAFPNRSPAMYEETTPTRAQPRMDFLLPANDDCARMPPCNDVVRNHIVVERHEVFMQPTIERGRLDPGYLDDRLPRMEDAFHSTPAGKVA